MDWSWGSDYVPLQYSDFRVEVTPTGNECLVSMTRVMDTYSANHVSETGVMS